MVQFQHSRVVPVPLQDLTFQCKWTMVDMETSEPTECLREGSAERRRSIVRFGKRAAQFESEADKVMSEQRLKEIQEEGEQSGRSKGFPRAAE